MKFQVIIITGQIAALKTTIAKQLAEDLSAYLLCKDEIKEHLSKTIHTSNRAENLSLSKTTFSLMHFMLTSLIKHMIPIIIEANFKEDEYDELVKTLKENNISYNTLYFFGTFEVLYNRYLKRLDTINPIHKSMGIISKNDFQESMNYYHQTYKKYVEVIAVDTTNFSDKDYNKIKKQL